VKSQLRLSRSLLFLLSFTSHARLNTCGLERSLAILLDLPTTLHGVSTSLHASPSSSPLLISLFEMASPDSSLAVESTSESSSSTKKKTKSVWSQAEDTKLVEVVNEVGTGKWGEVETKFEQEGYYRSREGLEQHYRLLKSRAEAQGGASTSSSFFSSPCFNSRFSPPVDAEPLTGSVLLHPFTEEEDTLLVALSTLHEAATSSSVNIDWSNFLTTFPGRCRTDLAVHCKNLKLHMKGRKSDRARVKRIEDGLDGAMKKLRAKFSYLDVEVQQQSTTAKSSSPSLDFSLSQNTSTQPQQPQTSLSSTPSTNTFSHPIPSTSTSATLFGVLPLFPNYSFPLGDSSSSSYVARGAPPSPQLPVPSISSTTAGQPHKAVQIKWSTEQPTFDSVPSSSPLSTVTQTVDPCLPSFPPPASSTLTTSTAKDDVRKSSQTKKRKALDPAFWREGRRILKKLKKALEEPSEEDEGEKA
jgi:hypothetical protein